MQNSKEIVPAWNKARQAMAEISSLLEEAEKETLKKFKPLMGKAYPIGISQPAPSLVGAENFKCSLLAPKESSEARAGERLASSFILSDVDINFGTLGQRIDLYFFSPVGCTERISKLVRLKDKSAKSLTDEELADLQILKKLSEGKTSSLQAYNQLDEIDGVIIRARINPTIEEIQTIVESDRIDIYPEQGKLKCAVDSSLVYECAM